MQDNIFQQIYRNNPFLVALNRYIVLKRNVSTNQKLFLITKEKKTKRKGQVIVLEILKFFVKGHQRWWRSQVRHSWLTACRPTSHPGGLELQEDGHFHHIQHTDSGCRWNSFPTNQQLRFWSMSPIRFIIISDIFSISAFVIVVNILQLSNTQSLRVKKDPLKLSWDARLSSHHPL